MFYQITPEGMELASRGKVVRSRRAGGLPHGNLLEHVLPDILKID